jgi:hypothetical protein
MNMDGRRILRWHAGFLMTLTQILTIGAYASLFTGAGPYGGLADNPMAVSGLAQAYPLMGLVAVAMWMGAHGPAPGASACSPSPPIACLFRRWRCCGGRSWPVPSPQRYR